jgi:P-type conjugative transfer ATPase TrbB
MSEVNESKERLLERMRRDFGPFLLSALADPKVVEVMRNADGRIWLDVAGLGQVDTGEVMDANKASSILGVAARMLDTVLTKENPILEGELPLDGSRIEGIIAPIVDTPIFAIRKKATMVFTLEDYNSRGMFRPGTHRHGHDGGLDLSQASGPLAAIKAAIQQRANILIVGGTGSGKTTLANAVNAAIAELCPTDRVIAIEEVRELQIPVQNHVLLRSSEHVPMTRLLRATMRLRPDRIIVGEVRGAEAYTLLKAWNSGHPGGVATVHADSASQGLQKFTDYLFEAPEAQASSPERLGRLIASAVQLVLFIERIGDAPGRAVSEICRVRGFQNGSFDLESIHL